MSMILKEIDLSFGQEGQKPNSCDNRVQSGTSVALFVPAQGRIYYFPVGLHRCSLPHSNHKPIEPGEVR